MSTLQKKSVIGKGCQPRQLKTIFGDVSFDLPRLRCKTCGESFNLMTGTLSSLEPLRDANITPALRRIAIRCGASWPFRQAQETLFELTGVQISHEQIRQLCSDEAQKVNAQDAQSYQKAYSEALVESMEVLVDYLSETPQPEPNRPPATPESERVYFQCLKVRAGYHPFGYV